ncbi:hypothetical protein LTS07_000947 [Exophiala sideris]|uniref:Uncharacterized protein n=1 Tax=Exophiala sideris TaxID=1016849 RepID=A0ABR0JS66_9EURO|nr:hypothetical protein LTS07_000947 [Exophiala sideris]KAK5043125.1 hypothetical protein LTR13_000896 [Exophiala sideris]KAK5068827.1 hypothetical protein LTR69_000948 [Exophiala sideris]KAK5186424.1 hypothetical protein LTR44_001480 [Eurotiomycetes sp. CCFEE 6388]
MAQLQKNNADKANTSSNILGEEEKHRGVINGEGKVVAPCSEDYLVSLMLEILRARAYPLVKLVRPHDMQAQVRRLQFISTEVRRLFHSPGLFPSLSIRARFAAILASDANLQFVQAVKELLLRDVVGALNQFSRNSLTRPTYLKDSKGWENFYLNMAPGAPTQQAILKTTPQSSVQSVPIVGMRVIADFSKEERLLRRWVKETTVPVDVKPAATTRVLNLDKPDEQDPNPKHMLRQECEDVSIRPNPISEDHKLRLLIPNHGPEPLEDYTPFLGRLEAPPLPQNILPATLNAPECGPGMCQQSVSICGFMTERKRRPTFQLSNILSSELTSHLNHLRHHGYDNMIPINPTVRSELESDYTFEIAPNQDVVLCNIEFLLT